MKLNEDPRVTATRDQALESALEILKADGLIAVSHGAVSKATGIARSTLYRHWPTADQLRNDALKRAAWSPAVTPRTNGPLHADLVWQLRFLVTALNGTPWGKIGPQAVALASTDETARGVLTNLMAERLAGVEAIFDAAHERGELRDNTPVRELVEMAIAVPYFRVFIAGLPIDENWLERHVRVICSVAVKPDRDASN